jgi:hypothetical protein
LPNFAKEKELLMNLDVTPWIGVLSAVWLLFFVFGRWQFNRVKQITTDLIMSECQKASRLHQRPTVEELYAQVQPAWETALKKSAWFILHKSELFPVPAWPVIVQKRLNFTPAWMGAYLSLNGMDLPASAELKAEIERIAALAPKKRKAKSR